MKKKRKRQKKRSSYLRTTANNFSTICLFLFPLYYIFFLYEKKRRLSCKPPSYYIHTQGGGRAYGLSFSSTCSRKFNYTTVYLRPGFSLGTPVNLLRYVYRTCYTTIFVNTENVSRSPG